MHDLKGEQKGEIMCKKEHGSQYYFFFLSNRFSWSKILSSTLRGKKNRKKKKGEKLRFLTFWGNQTLVMYRKTFTTEIIFDSKNVFKTMFLHVLKMAVNTPNLMCAHTHLQNNFNKAIKKKRHFS